MDGALLLAADVGGTSCRLGLFRGARQLEVRVVPTDGPDFATVALEFVGDRQIKAVGVAVAGPVTEGRAALTNHRWRFDRGELATALGTPVALLNDLAAAALGLPELAADSLRHVAGPPRQLDTTVVLGVGTGLGQALLLREGARWRVLGGEGGHAALPIEDAESLALWSWLAERHGRVSAERALSGAGLVALHGFFLDQGLAGSAEATAEQVGRAEDPASQAAVHRFARLLGARAGDVALEVLPPGGVVIVGGIARKLSPALLDAPLVDAFVAKGRMGGLMRDISIHIVQRGEPGLLGAAVAAAALSPG